MMYFDVAAGETLHVGTATVTLIEKSGRRARVGVVADPSLKVLLVRPEKPKSKPPPRQ
jgi:hypothetical protein